MGRKHTISYVGVKWEEEDEVSKNHFSDMSLVGNHNAIKSAVSRVKYRT